MRSHADREGYSSVVLCRVLNQIMMVSTPMDYLGIAAVGIVSFWRRKNVISGS